MHFKSDIQQLVAANPRLTIVFKGSIPVVASVKRNIKGIDERVLSAYFKNYHYGKHLHRKWKC